MIIPELPSDATNLTAAIAYGREGLYILPVRYGTKHPGSVVGERWQDKSFRDDENIVAWFAGTNHGIAVDLGRSGLVVFDVDKPELVSPELATSLDAAAAPYQRTRPDAPGRGHHVFGQPEGRRIGCSKGRFAGQGLDVKGAGGVIIVQPTWHPEGGEYRWMRVGEIPVLPTDLATGLLDSTDHDSAATDTEVHDFVAENTGAARLSIMSAWPRKFKTDVDRGDSRHDAMVAILPAALEEAKAGYFPARDIVEMLQESFIEAMLSGAAGRRVTESRAVYEYRSMLAWAVGQARTTPVAKVREKTEKNVGGGNDFSGLYKPPPPPHQEDPQPTPAGQPGGNTGDPDPIVNGHKRVHLTALAEIRSNVPTWAWEYDHRGRIQKGTLAILAGRPGAGKSNAARWFAAGFSNGTMAGCWQGRPVNVVYISPGEESWEYVIKPGMDAAGADIKRIMLPHTKDTEGNPERLMSAQHRDFLIECFRDNKVRVVIVDPIMSTIPGTANINQNNETRQHVEPWAQIAAAIDGVVLGVCHFTKFPGSDLVAAINGSSAFGEVARSIFGFVKDKKSGDRVMSQVKNSTGMEDLSLRYEIVSVTVPTDLGGQADVAAFNILGRSQLTASDVMDASTDGEVDLGGPGFAMAWLKDYLTEQGKAPAKQVVGKAKSDQDISRSVLYRAMKQLGVVSFREGFPCTAMWRLPTPEEEAGTE